MPDSLGAGSGRPGIPRTIGDYTVAGLATRVVTTAPTDADWGAETPPNGLICFQIDGEDLILWIRWGGTWRWAILAELTDA